MERKLKQDFRKFRNEFYKWEAYFARPRSKYYKKETAEFDKMVSDANTKSYNKLQKKIERMENMRPVEIKGQKAKDKILAKVSRGKKILLVDCHPYILFKGETKFVPKRMAFKFHLSTVSYKGKLLEEFIRQKIRAYIYENYEVEDVGEIAFRTFNLQNVYFRDIKHGRVSLQYKFLNDLNGIDLEQQYNDFLCVLRHIVESCQGKTKLKRVTIEKIKKEMSALNINYEKGVSVSEQIKWIERYHPNTISLYAMDPYGNVFEKCTAKQSRATLVYLCNNKHIYVINEKIQKQFVAKSKHLDSSVQVQFKVNANQYEYINQLCVTEDCWIDPTEEQMKVLKMPKEKREEEKQKYNDMVEGKRKGEVFLVDDPHQVALDVIEKCKPYTISNIKCKDSDLHSFIHPISGCVIEDGGDYEKRLEFCNELYKQLNCYNFTFKNQSFAQMASQYQEIKFGKLYKKSTYTKEHMELLDRFYTTPLMRTLVKNHKPNDNCKGFDINMCYTNAVLNMKDYYPVFCQASSPKKYKGGKIVVGEYLVEHFKIEQLGGMIFQKQWLSHNVVRRLLKKGYLPKSKIILEAKAEFCYSPDLLTDFIKGVLELFPREKYGKYTKIMCNAFIGMMGKRYLKDDKAFLTTDFETVQAMFCMYPEGFYMNQLDDLYFVRNTIETRMQQDHGPIFRQILCEGMWSVIELLEQVYGEGSKLISYKTDAVFVENPVKTIDQLDQTKYKAEKWKPYIYTPFYPRKGDDTVTEMKDWNIIQDIQFKGDNILLDGKIRNRDGERYIKKLRNMSVCGIGGPGCQKSTLLGKMYVPGETLVLCFTNKACQNILSILGKDAKVYTFDSKFYKEEDGTNLLNNVNRILVDEFSMTPLHWMEKLNQLKTQNNCIIHFYGDPNQCKPVETHNRYIDYVNRKFFREMCDNNMMIKKYVDGCARYDKDLHDVLEYLKQHKRLPNTIKSKKIKNDLETNISKTNPKRKEVNAQFHKGYYVGHKVISNKNIKTKGVYNSRIYHIHDIQNNKVALRNEKDGEPLMSSKNEVLYFNLNDFDPAYCITCYRYQGSTIEEEYNIYEAWRMSFNEIYTALSRGRSLDKIHFDYTARTFDVAKENNEPTLVKPRQMAKGEIYECYNETRNLYYVGYTTTTTKKRFQEHCQEKEDPIFKTGGTKEWKCKKIIDYYFGEKIKGKNEITIQGEEEIRKIEGYYIQEYYERGCKLVNTQKVPKGGTFKVTVGKVELDDSVLEKYSCEKGKLRKLYSDENDIEQDSRR